MQIFIVENYVLIIFLPFCSIYCRIIIARVKGNHNQTKNGRKDEESFEKEKETHPFSLDFEKSVQFGEEISLHLPNVLCKTKLKQSEIKL